VPDPLGGPGPHPPAWPDREHRQEGADWRESARSQGSPGRQDAPGWQGRIGWQDRVGWQDRIGWQDSIELRGLRFVGAHGALPEEAARAQPFEVDLSLLADLRPAGRSDVLSETVDYSDICAAVKDIIEGPHVNLIERLAEEIADRALAIAGPRAVGVVVTVRKLRPPVPVDLASAAVRICRP
jgi:dihydroneopterin aldolase